MAMIDVYARKDRGATVSFMDEHLYANIQVVSMINANNLYGKDVVVNVHGYKSDEYRVEKSFNTLSYNYPEFGVKARQIGFWWPASWSSSFGFITANMRVARASKYLTTLLRELRAARCRVVLQGHSLGCKVIIGAVEQMRTFGVCDNIGGAILTAPAIPNNYFETLDIPASVWKGLYKVFYSKQDPVLRIPYRLVPGNWKTPAMGLTGPSTFSQNVMGVSCNESVVAHSGYRDLPLMYHAVNLSFVSMI
jgi:esterase/lipase superfamily enzyme